VSACHAEGRGFEPRRSRHFPPGNGFVCSPRRRGYPVAFPQKWSPVKSDSHL